MIIRLLSLLFCLGTSVLILSSTGCQNNYSLAAASSATPTSGGSSSCTYPSFTNTFVPGIYMYGEIFNIEEYGTAEYEPALFLTVNGATYSTALVTLTGPGVSVSLPYSTTYTTNGTTYSEYYVTETGSLIPGDTYTLTVSTTSGTASSSLTLPPMPTVYTNGSGGNWTGPSMYNYAQVYAVASSQLEFSQSSCASSGSISIPSSAYPSSQNYTIEFESFNYTTSITGGQGVLFVGGINIIEI